MSYFFSIFVQVKYSMDSKYVMISSVAIILYIYSIGEEFHLNESSYYHFYNRQFKHLMCDVLQQLDLYHILFGWCLN